MTKPYIKRKQFSIRPAVPSSLAAICTPPEYLDLSFLDAVSCFETLRFYGGRAFCLREHIERLRESCVGLGKEFPCAITEVEGWLQEAVEESGYPDSIVRLSLHWPTDSVGAIPATMLADRHESPLLDRGGAGEIVVIFRPFVGHPRAWYEEGVDFSSSALRRPSPRAMDPQLKVSQYVSGVLAMIDHVGAHGRASLHQSHELLFFGDSGVVAEGSVSNLFIVKSKSVLTPSAASGILKGVTRSIVMDLARRRGYPVRETQLTRHELYTADECWMTNTSSEILPVKRIDGRTVGDGRPGPVTRQLAADFKTETTKLFS